MTKTKVYKYTGINGSIFSIVLLEDAKSAVFYQLKADEGKILTDGNETRSLVLVFPEDVDNWTEIDKNT